MKVELQCAKQVISDALAQGSINVVKEIFNKCRETINSGGTICIYDEYQAPINHRQNIFFDDIDDFEKWVNKFFPNL